MVIRHTLIKDIDLEQLEMLVRIIREHNEGLAAMSHNYNCIAEQLLENAKHMPDEVADMEKIIAERILTLRDTLDHFHMDMEPLLEKTVKRMEEIASTPTEEYPGPIRFFLD